MVKAKVITEALGYLKPGEVVELHSIDDIKQNPTMSIGMAKAYENMMLQSEHNVVGFVEIGLYEKRYLQIYDHEVEVID